eukprot:2916850-Rhodomonas_salina.1
MLPALLSQVEGRELESVQYSCDNVNTLDVVLRDMNADDGWSKKFSLKLSDGRVLGTPLNLCSTAFMFDSRDPSSVDADYSLVAQIKWAEQIVRISSVCENMRSVKQGMWCLYNKETGVWDEYPPKHAFLRRCTEG